MIYQVYVYLIFFSLRRPHIRKCVHTQVLRFSGKRYTPKKKKVIKYCVNNEIERRFLNSGNKYKLKYTKGVKIVNRLTHNRVIISSKHPEVASRFVPAARDKSQSTPCLLLSLSLLLSYRSFRESRVTLWPLVRSPRR